MYASFEEYTKLYGGTAIAKGDWFRLERKAEVYLDQITYDRLRHGPGPPPEEVRLAVCAVAEVIQKEQQAAETSLSSVGVKSFSNDGYSETLAAPEEVRRQYAKEKREAADVYLPLSHPLRYAGV